MQYAQLLYKDVPERCLPWEQRCPLLLAELLHWAPDILCLQVSQDGLLPPAISLGARGAGGSR